MGERTHRPIINFETQVTHNSSTRFVYSKMNTTTVFPLPNSLTINLMTFRTPTNTTLGAIQYDPPNYHNKNGHSVRHEQSGDGMVAGVRFHKPPKDIVRLQSGTNQARQRSKLVIVEECSEVAERFETLYFFCVSGQPRH